MKKVTWQRIGAAALAVLVWQTASMAVGSALLLPSPAAVPDWRPVGSDCSTDWNMSRTVRAVSGLTTSTESGRSAGTTVPSGVVVDLMIRGGMRTPSLAMVW